jgi:Fic family protein
MIADIGVGAQPRLRLIQSPIAFCRHGAAILVPYRRDATIVRNPIESTDRFAPEAVITLEPSLLRTLDADKARLDALRPLPAHTLASLREKLTLEWTYHSNAIEGNTLTLRETKVVLEGITVGGKTLREHFEATNHRDAILYVEEVVAKNEPLTEWLIRSLVLKAIDDKEAGRYRQENVVIAGASTTPPDFLHLPAEMANLVRWHEDAAGIHPVERAAELHTRFVKIHPFVDGNGRTGRLLLNLELMKAGYPPAIIRKEDRLNYYDALDEACALGDYRAITRLVAEAVERSLATYLEVLTPRA